MWKYFCLAICLLLITIGLFVSMVYIAWKSPAETTGFLNMVNASVVICDDFGNYSGVFIEDNVILTAAHCLKDTDNFKIELTDGTILESNDFYIDEIEDVGFIFVDANEINIAEVSLSVVDIGDTVYLVGTPHLALLKFTLTKGTISHLDRDIPEMGWEDLLQTDAEGGYGSSGGPLYDSEGRVIGIYVGHPYEGGIGVGLCENAKSILEAYQRCKDAKN